MLAPVSSSAKCGVYALSWFNGAEMGAREVLSEKHRTKETLSTEPREMLPCQIVFPTTSRVEEGSQKLNGVSCLWEFKSQKQRLGLERPEGQATGFLFVFEQMAQPPEACLSGCLSTVPGNYSLSLLVTPLSSFALTTSQSPGSRQVYNDMYPPLWYLT